MSKKRSPIFNPTLATNTYHSVIKPKQLAQILTVGLLLGTASTVEAGNSVWVGGASNNWLDANNWLGGQLPTAADDALINQGSVFLSGPGNANVHRIRLGNEANANAQLVINNGSVLDLRGTGGWIELGSEDDTRRTNAALPNSNSSLVISQGSKVYTDKMALSASQGANSTVVVEGLGTLLELTSSSPWQNPLFIDYQSTQAPTSIGGLSLSAVTPNFELNKSGTKSAAGKTGSGIVGSASGDSTFVLRDGATLKINSTPTYGTQNNPNLNKAANPGSSIVNYSHNAGIQLGQNFAGSGNSTFVIGSPLGSAPSAPGKLEFTDPNAVISMGAGAVAGNTAQLIFNHNDYSGNYRFDAPIQLSPLITGTAGDNNTNPPGLDQYTQPSGNAANNYVIFAHGITYIPDFAGTTLPERLPTILVQGTGEYHNSGVLRFDRLNLQTTSVILQGGFIELNPTLTNGTISGIYKMSNATSGGPQTGGLNVAANQVLTTESGVYQAQTGVVTDVFRFDRTSSNPLTPDDIFTLSGGGKLVVTNQSRQLLNISRGAFGTDPKFYEPNSPQNYLFNAKFADIVDGSHLVIETPDKKGNVNDYYADPFANTPFVSGWDNGIVPDQQLIAPRYSASLNRFLVEDIVNNTSAKGSCLAIDPHNISLSYRCSSRNDVPLLVQNSPTYRLSDNSTFELVWKMPFYATTKLKQPQQVELLEFFHVKPGDQANLLLSIGQSSKDYATNSLLPGFLEPGGFPRYKTQWVIDGFPGISLDRQSNRPAFTGGGTIVKQGWVSLNFRGVWQENKAINSYTGLSNHENGIMQTWYESHAYDGIQTSFIVEEGRYTPYHQLGADLMFSGALSSYKYNITTRGGVAQVGYDVDVNSVQRMPDHSYSGFLRKDDSLHPVNMATGENRGYIVGPIVGGIDINTGLPPPTYEDGRDEFGNPILVSFVEGMYYNPNGYIRKVGRGSNLTLTGNLADCTAQGYLDCGDGTHTADVLVESGQLTVSAETFKGDVVMTANGYPASLIFNESGNAIYNGRFLVDYGRFVPTTICTPSIISSIDQRCPTNLASDEEAAGLDVRQRLPVWRITSVVKKGAGTLTITDPSSYVGRLVVEEGTLNLAASALLNTRVQLIVKENATLDITTAEAFVNVSGGWATVDGNGDELDNSTISEVSTPAFISPGFVRLDNNSTLRAVLGGGRRPEITADVITIGQNAVAELGGLVAEDPNVVLKSSELTDIQYILMAARDARGISGSFINEQGGIATTLDYIVDAKLFKENNVWAVGDNLPCINPLASTADCQFYHQVYKVGSLALAWTEGNNETATGNFTINGNLGFEVDTTLEDRTDFKNFDTGWDGKTLRKKGTGTLFLSRDNNTYNGDTIIDEGTISISNDSQLGNGGGIYLGAANSKNAILQITGNDKTYEYNKDNTGSLVANNFYTVRPTYLNGPRNTVDVVEADQIAQFSRLVTDAFTVAPNAYNKVSNTTPGGFGVRGAGSVELIGGFNYKGSTIVESGSLLLDFNAVDPVTLTSKADNFIGGMGITSNPTAHIETSGTLVLRSDHAIDYSGAVRPYVEEPPASPEILTATKIRAGTAGKVVKEGNSQLSLYGASSVDWLVKEGSLKVYNNFSNNVVLEGNINPAQATFIDFHQAATGPQYSYLGTITGGLNTTLRTTGDGDWLYNYNPATVLYHVDVAEGGMVLSSETNHTNTLQFGVQGNFNVAADANARLVIRDPYINLNVGKHFELGNNSTLEVAINTIDPSVADITADSAKIGGANLKVLGFSRNITNDILKASEIGALEILLLKSQTAIVGDFNQSNVGVLIGPDYVFYAPEMRNGKREYWLTNMNLTWFANGGYAGLANGSFTMAEKTEFDVDVVLSDQAANPLTGWNGKDLSTYGLGDLTLSATNTYTGSTTVIDGGLILAPSNVQQSVIGRSSAVIIGDAQTESGAKLTIKGATTQVLNNLSMVTPTSSTAAAPALILEDSKGLAKIQNANVTVLAGDIMGKGGLLLNNASQATELILTGKTAYTGYTYLDQGVLTLDGVKNTAADPKDYVYAQLVSHVVGKNGTTLNLKNGARLTGSIDPTDVNIDARSVWELVPDSTNTSPYSSEVNRLNLEGHVVFTEPMENPLEHGRTLKAVHWHGMGDDARVLLYTNLGADNSPSDKIVIAAGGTATGQTKLQIMNQGGAGSQTRGNGIMIVDATASGATTEQNAFTLVGNRIVVDGVADYGLFRGAINGGGNSWYLRTEADPDAKPGEVTPMYRPEISVATVLPAMASRFGLATLGTYHDRMGAIRGENQQHMWARIYGETGEVRQDRGSQVFVEKGAGYDFDTYGTQLGLDVFADMLPDQTEQTAGLYLAFGHMDADAYRSDVSRAGDASMKAYSIGAYFTQTNPDGIYYDGVLQGTFYDQVKGVSTSAQQAQTIKTDGLGVLASIEAGYSIPLESEVVLQPQTQLIYQNIRLDDTQDNFSRFQMGSAQSIVGRLGVRAEYKHAPEAGAELTFFGRANLWHTFDGSAQTTVQALDNGKNTPFKTELGSDWLQLGLGVAGQVSDDIILSTSFDYQHAVGSGNHGHSIGGRINLKKSF